MSDRSLAKIKPPVQISLLLIGAVLLSSLALFWGSQQELRRQQSLILIANQDFHAKSLAKRAGEELTAFIQSGDREQLQLQALSIIRREGQLKGLRIFLGDQKQAEFGQLFAAASPTQSKQEAIFVARWLLPSTANPSGSSDVFAGPVIVEAHTQDPAGLAQTIQQLDPQPRIISLALAGGVLLQLGVALWIRRRMLKLGRIAEAISRGDFKRPPPLKGRDEFRWIADNLKEVAEIIDAQFDRMHGKNANLERDVSVQSRHIEKMGRLANQLISPVSQIHTYREALEAIVLSFETPLAMLFGADENGNGFHCLAGTWADGSVAVHNVQASPEFTHFQHRNQALIHPRLDPMHPWLRLENRKIPLEGVVYQPLLFQEQLQGVLVVAARKPFTEHDIEFFSEAAKPLAISLANRAAYQNSLQLAQTLEEKNLDLARQRDQLQELNRLRSQFVTNISHELRTPLNAIVGYAELVVDEIYGPINEAQQQAVEHIEQASRNLLELVNHVLDLSCIQNGVISLHPQTCDLQTIAREVIAVTTPLAQDRPYKPRLICPLGTNSVLETDPDRVRQILTNLVTNAIKFTEHGSVDLRLSSTENEIVVSVEDTGVGIDAKHLELIFQEFRQVDGSTTRQHDGVGLGLAISLHLAHALSGQLAVRSQPGTGSTFALTLPRVLPKQQATPQIAANQNPSTPMAA